MCSSVIVPVELGFALAAGFCEKKLVINQLGYRLMSVHSPSFLDTLLVEGNSYRADKRLNFLLARPLVDME